MVVTVATLLFDRQGKAYPDLSGWSTSPNFLVVTPDVATAAAALHAAAARFRVLDEAGEEHEDWDLDFVYTPKYVSPVLLTDEGPMIWTDTGGSLAAGMAAGMVRVLIEELEARDVTAHVTTAGPGPHSHLPEWRPVTEPTSELAPSAVPNAWFIVRQVLLTTTTGQPYWDHEFRAADGTWTWDRPAAQPYDESPAELVAVIRRGRRPTFRGEVTSMLLPVDDSDVRPRPPEHLRRPH